MTADTDSRNML